jgi:predicted RNA-binding Zn-ribbon protein involved in translation (DUF1610 family)
MTQEEIESRYVDCPNCGNSHTLKQWKEAHYNLYAEGLNYEGEYIEDVVSEVMMDCPSCGDPVYLSDGTIN